MAAKLDVNPSTVVRFTYRLGLNGFPDLQERMRELVRGQLSRTGDPTAERQGSGGHLAGTSFARRSATTGRISIAPSRASTRSCSAAQLISLSGRAGSM